VTSYNTPMAVPPIERTSAGVRSAAPRGGAAQPVIDPGTFLLAAAFSLVAALLTVVLATVGDVSQWSLVGSVTVIGFAASWVRSAREQRRRPAIVTIVH
jgi:hypothetical protein